MGIQALIDLKLYCDRFSIRCTHDFTSLLADGYGQLKRSAMPPDSPAACIDFQRTPDHENAPELAGQIRSGWKVMHAPVSERFFPSGDVSEVDLVGSAVREDRSNLQYVHEEPLPVPPLDQIDAIELSGMSSDLHTNNLFVIGMSTDRRSFQDVAVVRDDTYGGRPRPWHHTVEIGLFKGRHLFVRVKVGILPDMIADQEFALLPRLIIRYRPRR